MAMKVQHKHTTVHKELINWKVEPNNYPIGSTQRQVGGSRS